MAGLREPAAPLDNMPEVRNHPARSAEGDGRVPPDGAKLGCVPRVGWGGGGVVLCCPVIINVLVMRCDQVEKSAACGNLATNERKTSSLGASQSALTFVGLFFHLAPLWLLNEVCVSKYGHRTCQVCTMCVKYRLNQERISLPMHPPSASEPPHAPRLSCVCCG